MAQFSFKRHHDANILNDKHVVCTVKCWRHGCNHVVFNVKLGHAALILNRLLRLCLCLCLCSEFAKSLISKNKQTKQTQYVHFLKNKIPKQVCIILNVHSFLETSLLIICTACPNRNLIIFERKILVYK